MSTKFLSDLTKKQRRVQIAKNYEEFNTLFPGFITDHVGGIVCDNCINNILYAVHNRQPGEKLRLYAMDSDYEAIIDKITYTKNSIAYKN